MATNDKSYNGWTNYETWLVNLWLDNDGYSETLREMCKGQDAYLAGTTVRGFIDELREALDMPDSGMFCDLITAALMMVNWQEIGSHMVED